MNREVRKFDVLVVGGGPAGIAAATSAAKSGASVGMVDDNPSPGGQIWRGAATHNRSDSSGWIRKLQTGGVELLCNTRVFDQPKTNVLRAETATGICEFEYRNLILATGARERFLPFPGWTLPNVLGAGGLQALVKSGLPISGKRVVLAGTGPLLLAVAAYLKKNGAHVVAICEQASRSSLLRFGFSLLRHRNKVAELIRLRNEIGGIPFHAKSWPMAAEGDETLQAVVIHRSGRRERIACDYLACGFHLVPNTELASLLNCRMQNGFVQVDQFQRTSAPNVFCAGEPTCIGGLELSLVEGQIAGLAAVEKNDESWKLLGERRKLMKFAHALERTFALRPELKKLCQPETIVCRCEDVTWERLQGHKSWRAAKLQTRCGMGPCQGRICGSATEMLFDWKSDSVRPPIFPTTLANLSAGDAESSPGLSVVTRGQP
ncbi:MAG TPA: FAD/NAD(P)-binding oxidoreductase [Terriglobales bacterium]|nr:FAD/NAD(P)-binding oxidoreductase [Terriglobales bacterium]